MTTLRRSVLALDVLALVGCVVLAGWSMTDTSSSTSSLGVVVAVFLVVPFLLAAVLALVADRLEESGSTVLTALATLITVAVLGLLGFQLALGS
ncbi:unannotated protein [freshwater metagenome]|uniref:Unannotated protein n=1 Tax=freshwater metagenome TaxID=449393 RepID=A0A6J6VPV3_9ZZZZ|nr:hypothetical protein [Actinomycetota bacterium]